MLGRSNRLEDVEGAPDVGFEERVVLVRRHQRSQVADDVDATNRIAHKFGVRDRAAEHLDVGSSLERRRMTALT